MYNLSIPSFISFIGTFSILINLHQPPTLYYGCFGIQPTKPSIASLFLSQHFCNGNTLQTSLTYPFRTFSVFTHFPMPSFIAITISQFPQSYYGFPSCIRYATTFRTLNTINRIRIYIRSTTTSLIAIGRVHGIYINHDAIWQTCRHY